MTRAFLPLLAFLVLVGGAAPAVHADQPERSPFDMVRFTGEEDADVEVQLDGRWYRLIRLDGVSTAEVMEACRRLDPKQPRKRFCEDLVAAMAKAGKPLRKTATVVGIPPGKKRRWTLRDVAEAHVVLDMADVLQPPPPKVDK